MAAVPSVVKLTAKTALKSNWIQGIAACLSLIFDILICYLSFEYIAYITNLYIGYALFALMIAFIIVPHTYGVARFFWRMIFGAKDLVSSVFYAFSDKTVYKRIFKLTFSLSLKALILGAFLYFPSIVVDIFSGSKVYELMGVEIPLWISNLAYISPYLKVIATAVLLFSMSRYYLSMFLLIADEKMEPDEAIHMSVVISKVAVFDFLYLLFSLLGWILISILVFPLIFTLPYMITSFCVHVRFTVAEYNKSVDLENQSNYPTYEVGF